MLVAINFKAPSVLIPSPVAKVNGSKIELFCISNTTVPPFNVVIPAVVPKVSVVFAIITPPLTSIPPVKLAVGVELELLPLSISVSFPFFWIAKAPDSFPLNSNFEYLVVVVLSTELEVNIKVCVPEEVIEPAPLRLPSVSA